MAGRIERAAGGSLSGKTVGTRALFQTRYRRRARGAKPHHHSDDPGAWQLGQSPPPAWARERRVASADVIWCSSAMEAADQPDVTVVVTEWNEVRALDLKKLRLRMRGATCWSICATSIVQRQRRRPALSIRASDGRPNPRDRTQFLASAGIAQPAGAAVRRPDLSSAFAIGPKRRRCRFNIRR